MSNLDIKVNHRRAPKYDWFVCLARHPDHVNRDPRRAWQYECCTGKHSAEDYLYGDMWDNPNSELTVKNGCEYGDRVYYFEKEHDMLMFSLRWQNSK